MGTSVIEGRSTVLSSMISIIYVASAVNLPIRIHSRLSKSQMGEFENLDKLSGVLDVTLVREKGMIF